MAKKTGARRQPQAQDAGEAKPATLKDLLPPELVGKLKAQADDMKDAEQKRREEARRQAEATRKAEQKRLENDFEYLLNNSDSDWRKHK